MLQFVVLLQILDLYTGFLNMKFEEKNCNMFFLKMGGGGVKHFGAFPKIQVLVLSPVPKYAHSAYFQVILSFLTLVSIVAFFTTSEALTGEHLFLCRMMHFMRFGRRVIA